MTKEEKLELTQRELVLLSRVLFSARWSGKEWQETITPLINKLAKMATEPELTKKK